MSVFLNLNGLFLINKPPEKSSFYYVKQLKRKFNLKKVGHAGTLDPQAEGLLVILVGNFTKKFDYFRKLKKEYLAKIVFGLTTDTYDKEGKVIGEYKGKIRLTKNKLSENLKSFLGEINQIPPQFSAVKIKGQPAYKRARAGQSFEIKPKKVIIYQLKIISLKDKEALIKIICSSGTYIRSLAYDLGQKIGTGAYLADLKRLSIGQFNLSESKDLKEIEISDLIGEIKTH